MSEATLPIHQPARAGAGRADRLHPVPQQLRRAAGQLPAVGVHPPGRAGAAPKPTRLRLLLAAAADPDAVRGLLVREQGCCAFLGFTVAGGDGWLVADLEVPAEAASTLDAIAALAELSAPWVAR